MSTINHQFKASELCSRKLWQLVNTEAESDISAVDLRHAVAELAERRHYLEELKRLGKLSQH